MFWWGGCTKIDPNFASSDNLLKYLWSPFITLHAAPGQLFLQIRCHLSEKVKIIKNVGVVHFKLSAARRCRTDPILICYSQRQLTNLQYHRQIVKRFTFTQFTEWYFLFFDTTFLSGTVSVNMSIELLQWWRWNQFVSFEFWWQKSCCYCLCQWCCCYNDTMLPNNDTKYFHSRWSLSIGLACRSASPLGLGGETVLGSILQSVLGGVSQYDLVKNPQFTKWVAMFRTKNPINYIANVCL